MKYRRQNITNKPNISIHKHARMLCMFASIYLEARGMFYKEHTKDYGVQLN